MGLLVHVILELLDVDEDVSLEVHQELVLTHLVRVCLYDVFSVCIFQFLGAKPLRLNKPTY